MSQEHIVGRGSAAFELQRVDRILSELSRPALDPDSMAPSTRGAMLELGICVAGDASREDLIVGLWDRKRLLLRRIRALSDWDPMQPVA